MEIERYTLATGETVLTGFSRLGRHWGLVFALLVRTCQAYRGDRFVTTFGWLLIPFFAGVGVVLGFGALAAAHLALMVLDPWLDFPADQLLVAVPIFLCTFAVWNRGRATDRAVEVRRVDGRVDSFELGRLHEVFEASEPSLLGFFSGVCFGVQAALLHFAGEQVGLPPSGGLGAAGLLTLDNACHGLFLDTFELYQLHWGAVPDHTFWSATLFYAFRIAFDAFAVMTLLIAYRRFQIRHLFRGFPYDPGRLDDLLGWIEARAGDRNRWAGIYFDEFLFLVLLRAYLQGNLGFVRHLSRQFPWLAISPEVRALFTGPDGQTVLRGAGPSPAGRV